MSRHGALGGGGGGGGRSFAVYSPTKPSIKSPDTLTHHCSPPTGVMKASFSVFTPVPWEKAATRCKVVYPL